MIGCEIVASSGSALLDAAACPLYTARARFTPARNPAGGAVCDVTTRPTSPPSPAVPGSLEHFLIERYILYVARKDSGRNGRLRAGRGTVGRPTAPCAP